MKLILTQLPPKKYQNILFILYFFHENLNSAVLKWKADDKSHRNLSKKRPLSTLRIVPGGPRLCDSITFKLAAAKSLILILNLQ